MVDVQSMGPGLSHVVFLERAAREQDSAQSRFGQAAFLVLRLIDLLGAEQAAPSRDDLFGYQAAATGRYCHEQLAPGPLADRLLELVSSATYAHRRTDPGFIAPAMIGLARDLLEGMRPDEALDVLGTLRRAAGTRLESSAAITVALLRGRAKRLAARFDEAEAAYGRAGALAAAAGDQRSVLLSRLGRVNVLLGRGNLAAAERADLELLRDAQALADRDLEARVEHSLGAVLGARGELPDAIPHLWQAFELLQHDEEESLRALQDLGYALSKVGAVDGAERAFRYVITHARTIETLNNARIELMHCASFRRDRVSFTRWSSECARMLATMAPNQLADYHLKVGIGLARFGLFDRTTGEMRLALDVARANGLHEFEFRIERILAGLPICLELQHEAETEQPAWATVSSITTALAGLVP